MGGDISTYVEQKDVQGEWEHVMWPHNPSHSCGPFDARDYDVFGWLADLGNLAMVPCITVKPRGMPGDASSPVSRFYREDGSNVGSTSWLSVDELTAFDYDATFEYRRLMGSGTCEPGKGVQKTYRETLKPRFFEDLSHLKAMNAERPTRVVFWFDT